MTGSRSEPTLRSTRIRQVRRPMSRTDPLVDINVLVLGSSCWPFKAPNTPFNLPRDIARPYEKFKSYYISKHSNRKLTMLWQHCKGEIKAVFTKGNKAGFIFQVRRPTRAY